MPPKRKDQDPRRSTLPLAKQSTLWPIERYASGHRLSTLWRTNPADPFTFGKNQAQLGIRPTQRRHHDHRAVISTYSTLQPMVPAHQGGMTMMMVSPRETSGRHAPKIPTDWRTRSERNDSGQRIERTNGRSRKAKSSTHTYAASVQRRFPGAFPWAAATIGCSTTAMYTTLDAETISNPSDPWPPGRISRRPAGMKIPPNCDTCQSLVSAR